MGLDPDIVRAKPRSTIERWIRFAKADGLYDEWKADEAQATLERQLEGR